MFKLFSKCENCKETVFITKPSRVWIAAIRLYATSRIYICSKCSKALQSKVNPI